MLSSLLGNNEMEQFIDPSATILPPMATFSTVMQLESMNLNGQIIFVVVNKSIGVNFLKTYHYRERRASTPFDFLFTKKIWRLL